MIPAGCIIQWPGLFRYNHFQISLNEFQIDNQLIQIESVSVHGREKSENRREECRPPAETPLSQLRRRQQSDQVCGLRTQGLLPRMRESLRLCRTHALITDGGRQLWVERVRARRPSA